MSIEIHAMKKIFILLAICCLLSNYLHAQIDVRKVNIDISSYLQQLNASPKESSLGIGNISNSATIISLPMPDGSSARFKVVEYSVLPIGTNSDAKTYLGEQEGNSAVTCRITTTKAKLIATIYINGQIVVIEQDTQSTLSNIYNVYIKTAEEFECSAKESLLDNKRVKAIDQIKDYTNGTSLRTYRMAIMVTNEFYQARGNTDVAVNNEVAAIINSLNGLYEKEIAVRFTLKSPINPASANVFYRNTNNINTYYQAVDALRSQMNTLFGSSNYDLGHALHTTGGGVAYFGVCVNDYKGGGWSGSTTPSSFLLMAHEVGHQFTAPHTFNGNGNANCGIGNRNTPTAFEPGSGNTIMSYSGLCGPGQNITGGQVPYFHTNSLDRMINYIQTGSGNTCGTPTATGNTPPVANAGGNYTIPKNTPFTLTGSGTDANGDVLSFTWEEYDAAMASDSGKLGHTGNAVNSTTAPLFRTRQSSSPIRNFPDMAFVLNTANNPPDQEGEDLPNVARTMTFRLTARDNRTVGGGVDMSSVTITVDGNKGPLAVTAPNGSESWAAGISQNVTWSVNSTNALSANVKILLSIDGGSSFPYTLAASTSNDGTLAVVIPSNIPNTTQARIKIVSTNSTTAEFFDASNANFTITSNCNVATTYICPETPVSGNSGNAAFNLGLSKISGSLFLNKSKNVSFSGETARRLIAYTDNTFSTCYTHEYWEPSSQIVAFRVSQTGNYSISTVPNNTGSTAFSIFNSSTFNCSTFVGSNAFGEVSWFGSRSISLNACTTYYAVVYNFNSSSSFVLNVNGTGDVIQVLTDPAGFNYTYVAVNQTNNQIAAFSASSDFRSISGGSFKVYGLSYANGFNTNNLLNKTIDQVYGLGTCLLFSNNSKSLTIIPSPCPSSLVLTNPANNITSGNITRQASATNGKITAKNLVTGTGTKATYQAKAIELNAGFRADSGTIFRAETGGCN